MDAMRRQTSVDHYLGVEAVETKVLQDYYSDNEFFLSPEWILKVLSVLVSIAASALFLTGGCAGTQGLAASGAVVALACAGAGALLCAAAASQLPQRAPRATLFADLIISTVMGVLLLVTAILSMVFCQMNSVSAYLHGPLGITNAALVTSSAVVTYVAVTRRLDAARPAVEPPRPRPREQEA